MRFRDIFHAVVRTSTTHPLTVIVSLHPTRWSEFAEFITNSPRDFRLLSKLQPEPLGWIVHVGCSSEAAQARLADVWG